jgi:hypothetical protein
MSKTSGELDEMFGQAKAPSLVHPWEVNRVPRSKSNLDKSTGQFFIAHKKLSNQEVFKFTASTITYLWAMDNDGKIHVAVEELAELPDHLADPENKQEMTGHPRMRGYPYHPATTKKLGHPTLLAGAPARIAGELFLDCVDGETLKWHMNDNSGRYCNINKPTKSHKKNLLEFFQNILGEPIAFDDVGEPT